MTGLYDILKANRLKKESDPWLCILGEAWMASEEDYKEYTGLVPYTFIGNGQPLVSWMIKGNTVQSGTPTPDNPIMPQGTGDRTGNLLLYPYSDGDGNYNGVNVEVGIDGKIVGSGQTTAGTNFRLAYINMKLLAGTYTLSVYGVHTGFTLFIRDTLEGTNIAQIVPSNDDRSTTFTLQEDTSEQVSIYFNTGRVGVDVSLSCYVMLNTGSQPLPYEPFGYKTPISSSSTTTPVYLGEVQTTRKIKKLVLTGNEDWSNVVGSGTSTKIFISLNSIADGLCNTFVFGDSNNIGEFDLINGTYLRFNVSGIATTKAEWVVYLQQQYAAGTPVTVWYVLATPETAVVNEPLMKIGEYADTLSDVVSIPTVRGENVFDVNTEVKPSEVYIKYKSR